VTPLRLLTLCDLAFLPQALVLHRSLRAVAPEACLRVLAVDDDVARFWRDRADPTVSVTTAGELEALDPELPAARPGRSRREWCWTLAPALCRAELASVPEDAAIAFVDADIAFFLHPGALVEAMGSESALLIPHRYDQPFSNSETPQWLEARYGSVNGGTVVLRNDPIGRRVASEWRARTLGWCHDRVEPGRYGNQRYLEPLAALEGVRVAPSIGIGLAPWNVGHHRLSGTVDAPRADGVPAVFFHFQSLRLRRARAFHRRPLLPGNYLSWRGRPPHLVGRLSPRFRVTASQRRLLWMPYVRSMRAEIEGLGELGDRWWADVPEAGGEELADDWRIRRDLAAGWIRRFV
jgi:hypothetical protein